MKKNKKRRKNPLYGHPIPKIDHNVFIEATVAYLNTLLKVYAPKPLNPIDGPYPTNKLQ